MAGVKRHASELSNKDRLVEAAVRCIAKFGVAKTTIDDVAREAGLSRPTAYRTFVSRKELLEHVAERSIAGMEQRLRVKVRKYANIADTLVLGTLEAIREAQRDAIFMATLDALGDRGLERYMLNPEGPTFGHVQAVWSEVLPAARARGELRAELNDYDIATYLCTLLCVLILRDDMNRRQQDAFLRKFMLPTLLSPAALSKAG